MESIESYFELSHSSDHDRAVIQFYSHDFQGFSRGLHFYKLDIIFFKRKP